MRDYLPSRDADFDLWGQNFSSMITAAPALFGLLAPDAVAISAVVVAFTAGLAIARDPSTRTTVTVNIKTVARWAAEAVIRPYAMQIKASAGVIDANKIAVGVGVRDRSPSPIPAPITYPLLSIVGASTYQHIVRFSDSGTPDSRSKPAGAVNMLLFCSVGATPPANPALAPLKLVATRNPVVVPFDAGDVGKTAHYYARWASRTGELGPFSALASMTVAG